MIFQSVYLTEAFSKGYDGVFGMVRRIVGVAIVLLPVIVERIASKRARGFYFSSVQDLAVFTFSEFMQNFDGVKKIVGSGKRTFSKKNLEELFAGLPQHDSFRYINKGSLTDEYFDLAKETLDDRKIYIIISNTGSPASEIISLFTRKQYNHASLSFDRELKTIVSYNGGEKIYPPGLNMETIKYFNKKPDSSMVVYSLAIPPAKKLAIISKIRKINEEGNAYNVLGLITKNSFRPNIMFCSQFVYRMLKFVGLAYFDKKDGQIKPTDFIELDYDRKLKYEYKIRFEG
jgi:hypothetical protein